MITPTTNTFSEQALQALHIAARIAAENGHATFGAGHLLKALLHKDLPVLKFLEARGIDVYYLEEWAEIRIEEYPKGPRPVADPEADDQLKPVFKEADHLQHKLNYHLLEAECLLLALSTPGVAFSYEQLKTFPLSSAQAITWYAAGNTVANKETAPKVQQLGKASSDLVSKYCTDKLAQAREGSLQPVIGRDKELRQVFEIISRKNKSNVILTGDAGVGKTALLDGFARAVASGQVPAHLSQLAVFELDKGALQAGASYKGEIEDRLRKVMLELNQLEKPVLMIDELHVLLDKQGGGVGNILKEELAKGILTVIGTTTTDEYRKSIEKDETFSRRFEIVKIEEPDVTLTEKMLRQQAEQLQLHHKLSIADAVFAESILLAKRFVKERRLPDSALDLLDRSMAVTRMSIDTALQDVQTFIDKLNSDDVKKETSELQWLYREIQSGLSPVLLAMHNEDKEVAKLTDSNELLGHIDATLNALKEKASQPKEHIDDHDLRAVVANMTGIPLGKIQTKEQQRLQNMEAHLMQRVIGQDHALKTVADAILESRSGLNKAGQPIASFFFLGPTGTGKTELAKSLAEYLFQDENSIIRFDMSEFKEEHSAALLYGAPPGYVGYEEGGMLVNKIRQQPYAIVLFDEIEKAHPSVFDIFLQILDEGKMHDRLGKEGDFSNAVILFTSNIGAEHIIKRFESGQIPKSDELMEIMTGYFRPEFLARVTEIIPFAPVSKENVEKIFRIHLKPLVRQLEQKNIQLELTPAAVTHLANLGFTPRYGVRPLKGVIRTQLRKPLSRMLISETLLPGQQMQVDVDASGELLWNVSGASLGEP